jgi:hypothetical protein
LLVGPLSAAAAAAAAAALVVLASVAAFEVLVSALSLPTGDSRRIRFRFSVDFFRVLDSASWISELILPVTNDEVVDFSGKREIQKMTFPERHFHKRRFPK